MLQRSQHKFNKPGKRLAALAAVILLAGGMLAGCSDSGTKDKTFRFPLSAEPRQVDPQVSTDSASVAVVAAAFEGLAKLDKNEKAVPAAATWKVSDDGLVYTFSIKKASWSTVSDDESPFHEPQPVKADDFVFGMQRAVLPGTKSTMKEMLYSIRNAEEVADGKLPVTDLGVRAVNDNTLEITLTKADKDFPQKLTQTPFMPCNRAFFESTQGQYGLEPQFILSNGPFYVSRWKHNEYISLTRHDGYTGEVYPAGVRYVITPNDNPMDAMINGTLDGDELPIDRLEKAKQNGMQIVPLKDTVDAIWLNQQIDSLSHTNFRLALRQSLEWTEIDKHLDSRFAEKATGFVPPDAVVGTQDYRTAKNALPTQTNVDAAQTNLHNALKAMNADKAPTLTVLCADDDYSTNLARYVVQSWQKNLSLYCHIETVDAAALATRVSVANYEVAIAPITMKGMTAQENLKMYQKDSADNVMRSSGAKFEQLAADMDTTLSRPQVEQLEQALWQDCPCIPLAFHTRFYALGSNVKGITVRPFQGGAFGTQLDFTLGQKKED